jgi:hypothetical protein
MKLGRVNRDVAFLGFLTLFFLVFLVESFHFRGFSAPYPRLISGIGLFLSLYTLLGKLRPRECPPAAACKDGEERKGFAWWVLTLLLLVYLGLTWVAGFALATCVSLASLARLLGMRRWSVIALFAAVSTAAMVLVFRTLLHVPLPRGVLSL